MENANNFELFTDMTMDDVREYEKNMHEKTNIKVCNQHSSTVDEIESHAKARVCSFSKTYCPSSANTPAQIREEQCTDLADRSVEFWGGFASVGTESFSIKCNPAFRLHCKLPLM